jgi:phage terminase small subunit
MAAAEAAQLEEACRTRDRIKELDSAVTKDGLMIPSSQGVRLHPAVSEARAQRLALARILATLGVPGLDEDLPAARSVRGVYTGRGRR